MVLHRYTIQPHDTLETVRQRVLGPPGSAITLEFERMPQQRITVTLARASAGRGEQSRLLEEAYREIQSLRQRIEDAEEGEVTLGKKNSRFQRSAPPPPPVPLISEDELGRLRKDLDMARTMSTDLKTAHIALTQEYDRVVNERAQAQSKNLKEVEEYRVQVRQLREQQLTLTSEHARELQQKSSALDAAMLEADALRRQMHNQQQMEAKSALLSREKEALVREKEALINDNQKLEADIAQLHKEMKELFGEMRAQKEHAVAAHQDLHTRLAEALEKEYRSTMALDQITARMASRLSPLNVIARWVKQAEGAAFRAWRARVDELNRSHCVMRKCLKHWISSQLSAALHAWRVNASELHRRRGILSRVTGRWAHAMDNWKWHTREQNMHACTRVRMHACMY